MFVYDHSVACNIALVAACNFVASIFVASNLWLAIFWLATLKIAILWLSKSVLLFHNFGSPSKIPSNCP